MSPPLIKRLSDGFYQFLLCNLTNCCFNILPAYISIIYQFLSTFHQLLIQYFINLFFGMYLNIFSVFYKFIFQHLISSLFNILLVHFLVLYQLIFPHLTNSWLNILPFSFNILPALFSIFYQIIP